MTTNKTCKHNFKELSYIQWMDYAENKIKQGEKQKQCSECKKWFFKDEF